MACVMLSLAAMDEMSGGSVMVMITAAQQSLWNVMERLPEEKRRGLIIRKLVICSCRGYYGKGASALFSVIFTSPLYHFYILFIKSNHI